VNIVLIAVDTLRSDALSCYGNPKPTSPHIDRLARRGALLENFYSVGNCTHPGFTSLASGMYPESSRVVSHWTRVSPPDELPMIAQYFADAGFNTAAVDNLYDGWRPKHPYYPWFRRGFSSYGYPPGQGHYRPGADVSKMACEWLRSKPPQPFLLFIHYWDTHAPYNKAPHRFYRFYDGNDPCDPRLDYMPPEVRERQRRIFGRPITDPGYVVAAYHAETAYVDDCLGALLSRLAKLGLTDETMVVVTSDHGDIMSVPRSALGRLWCFCHIGLNEDCLRIPLIMAGPGIAEAATLKHRFQLVDLLPTLLDLAGIPKRIELDGRSFSAALSGGQAEGRDELYFSENTYQKQRAVLAWAWKYMRMEARYDSMAPRCLYNLERDPLETVNLSDAEPKVARRMEELLHGHVSRTTRGAPDPLVVQDVTSTI